MTICGDACDESAHGTDESLIEVAVALPVHASYTYAVPDDLRASAGVGKRVLVPFGPRLVTGYVLGPSPNAAPPETLKPIADVLDDDPLLTASMLTFLRWVAHYYIHPLGEVIRAALPGGLTVAERAVYELSDQGRRVLDDPAGDPQIHRLLALFAQGPRQVRRLNVKGAERISRARINQSVSKGWLVRRLALTGGSARPKMERYAALVGDAPPRRERLSPQRRLILDLLADNGPMALNTLKTHVASAAALIRSMAAEGLVACHERQVFRDPFGEPIAPDTAPALTGEQALAVDTLGAALGQGFQTYVLAGVTGSGKTEVYLHTAARALKMGLAVLVLVPEIALISQMERAFRARFGQGVAVLHSGLSQGERYDQWCRVARGDAGIAIGARSALFAPFDRVGLIIVDEEHDDSYKQEGALRYHARDMAVVRGKQNQALVVLGSATPSLQSFYNVQTGKFKALYLWQRVDHSALPRIHTEDLGALREEKGIRRFLTPTLVQAMRQTLENKQQILLFLNRRGFAGTLVCATCGQGLLCDRCDISLTYHQRSNAYTCHYCGLTKAAIARCSRCGSGHIKRLGVGTERLESEIRTLFPAARVARMDRDTTRRKGELIRILKTLRQRKTDILIGTQMVAKGHDYPGITLVGIICADLSLSLPDFRAGERTFQLLAQVAGRAGRGSTPGEVILQTYNPDHFSIHAARNQDFEVFYRQEIQFRKALGYPPFTRMVQIRVSGRDKERAAAFARDFGVRCQEEIRSCDDFGAIEVLGPIEAPLSRIADQYRFQMLLKSSSAGRLHRLVRKLFFMEQTHAGKADCSMSLDVDPVFLL